jgi:hypothetical protein
MPVMKSEQPTLDLSKILLPNRRYVFHIACGRQPGSRLANAGRRIREFLGAMLGLNHARRQGLLTGGASPRLEAAHPGLSFCHALQVKSAEYWLILGEPFEALAELQTLPDVAKRDPWVLKVMVKATGMARARQAR